MSFDQLVDNHSLFVIRRSDVSEEETFHKFNNGNYILNDDAIENKRVPNLSVNLIGGLFKNEHSKFIPLNKGSERWTGKMILLFKYLKDYRIDENKGLIFINVNELHNKQIPYVLPSNPNIHKEVAKFQKAFGLSTVVQNTPPNDIELLGKIYFMHDPINLNYWHVEFKIQNYKEEGVEKASNVSNKALVDELLNNWIKINSTPIILNPEMIKSKFYCA